MTQRTNDYQALYTAAADLLYIGDESVSQMTWLIGAAQNLQSSWSDPQYNLFLERMEEYRDRIAAFHQKNVVTCEAVRTTAKKIEEYLATLNG